MRDLPRVLWDAPLQRAGLVDVDAVASGLRTTPPLRRQQDHHDENGHQGDAADTADRGDEVPGA